MTLRGLGFGWAEHSPGFARWAGRRGQHCPLPAGFGSTRSSAPHTQQCPSAGGGRTLGCLWYQRVSRETEGVGGTVCGLQLGALVLAMKHPQTRPLCLLWRWPRVPWPRHLSCLSITEALGLGSKASISINPVSSEEAPHYKNKGKRPHLQQKRKGLWKIQYPLTGTEGNILNLIHGIYKKPASNVILSGKTCILSPWAPEQDNTFSSLF